MDERSSCRAVGWSLMPPHAHNCRDRRHFDSRSERFLFPFWNLLFICVMVALILSAHRWLFSSPCAEDDCCFRIWRFFFFFVSWNILIETFSFYCHCYIFVLFKSNLIDGHTKHIPGPDCFYFGSCSLTEVVYHKIIYLADYGCTMWRSSLCFISKWSQYVVALKSLCILHKKKYSQYLLIFHLKSSLQA